MYLTGGTFATRAAIDALRKKRVNVDLLMIVAAVGSASIGGWTDGGILLCLFSWTAPSRAAPGHYLFVFTGDQAKQGNDFLAVIDAVAASSDGRSLGLTAPRREGQRRALERAYGRSGVSPASVGLVEAHGTGTVVGDRTELSTLTEVYSERGASPGSTTGPWTASICA